MRRSLHMRHGSAQLQSVSQPVDGSRRTDGADPKDPDFKQHNAIRAGRRAVMLRLERERLRDEVVCWNLGRHEGIRAANGSTGYDPGTVGQWDGTSARGTGELRHLPTDLTPLPQAIYPYRLIYLLPASSVYTYYFSSIHPCP